MFAFRKWGLHHLLGSWVVYWVGLAAVTLGPFAPTAWRISRLQAGRSDISAALGDGRLKLSATVDGATVWAGSAGLGATVAWIVVPPLLLWVMWLVAQTRARGRAPGSADEGAYLGAAPFEPGTPEARSRDASEIRKR